MGNLLKCMKKVIFGKNNVDQNPPLGHDFRDLFMTKNSPRCVLFGGVHSCECLVKRAQQVDTISPICWILEYVCEVWVRGLAAPKGRSTEEKRFFTATIYFSSTSRC